MLLLLNNSKYFDITIKSLSESFTELNIKHKIVDDFELDDNIYIICTTHLDIPTPKRYISYNCEQLTTDKKWSMNFINRLKKAEEVWDYSLENMNVLKKYEIEALHLPIGYSKCMELNKLDIEKNIDVLFMGCINESRLLKMNNLRSIYYKTPEKFLITNDCWEDREEIYNRTKIALNLHFYGGRTILEVHRIVPLIANKIFVISERSDDIWYDYNYQNVITYYDNLVKTTVSSLKMDNFNDVVEARYNYLIKNLKFVDFVELLTKSSKLLNRFV